MKTPEPIMEPMTMVVASKSPRLCFGEFMEGSPYSMEESRR
jgi:hypothetical protein